MHDTWEPVTHYCCLGKTSRHTSVQLKTHRTRSPHEIPAHCLLSPPLISIWCTCQSWRVLHPQLTDGKKGVHDSLPANSPSLLVSFGLAQSPTLIQKIMDTRTKARRPVSMATLMVCAGSYFYHTGSADSSDRSKWVWKVEWSLTWLVSLTKPSFPDNKVRLLKVTCSHSLLKLVFNQPVNHCKIHQINSDNTN